MKNKNNLKKIENLDDDFYSSHQILHGSDDLKYKGLIPVDESFNILLSSANEEISEKISDEDFDKLHSKIKEEDNGR